MAISLSSLARRAAGFKAVRPLAVRIEDVVSYRRAFGILGGNSSPDRELSLCSSEADLLGFSQRYFPPTQIPGEISSLLRLANAEKVQHVCEIGTAQGGVSFLLLRAIEGVRFALSLDLQVRHRSLLRRFAPAGCEFHAIDGSSYSKATISKVERLLAGRRLDLVFIDGDHRFEGVRADYLAYRELVRDGGLIAFHDIQPGNREEPGEPLQVWSGGVPRVWREVKAQAGESWEFIEDSTQQGFGIGVVRNSRTP